LTSETFFCIYNFRQFNQRTIPASRDKRRAKLSNTFSESRV
ncbi:MAG: hypothetical protein ACI9R8_002129, partial [Candidatus Paceibacteria bacterium]